MSVSDKVLYAKGGSLFKVGTDMGMPCTVGPAEGRRSSI